MKILYSLVSFTGLFLLTFSFDGAIDKIPLYLIGYFLIDYGSHSLGYEKGKKEVK